MTMVSFIGRWLIRLMGVVAVVVTICFAIVEMLPGDVAFQVAAARYNVERVTPETRASVQAELGLDRPACERFGTWLPTMARGDLGRSVVSGQRVSDLLAAPLGRTLLLVALAWPLSVALGLLLGFLFSRSSSGLATAKLLGALASGTPTYVLGLLLILYLSIGWRLLPSAGYGGLAFLVLPALTLGLRGAMRLALVASVSLAEASRHPSVAFARMKGMGEFNVATLHAFPLAAGPVVAFMFVSLAAHLEGIVVIEELFTYPGLGKLLFESVIARDVPVIQAVAIVLAALIVTCNMIADLLSKLFERGERP